MAGSRIRGITVEIGGNTTKLDKALAGTNKEIANTQKNLKDVEKLLKLDPGNVELLGQKQQYLAKAAEETAKKYEELKKHMAEVTVDDAKYKQFVEVQTQLTGEITKSEKELAKLNAEAEKLRKQGFAPDSAELLELQSKIDGTKNHIDELNGKITQTYEEFGRPVSTEQFNSWNREMIESKKNAEKSRKEYERFNVTLEEFSAKAKKVSDVAGKVSSATKGISAAAAGGAAGLIGMAVKAGQAADDLNTLAKQSGFATDTLQKWQYASDLVDVSVDDIVGAARKMEKNMASTSSSTIEAWEKIGVSVRDSSGNFRDAESVFNDALVGLSQIPNEVERDTVAMELFGKSANDLAGIVDDGGAALRAYGKEAEDLGLILSQDALDGANAFNDGIDKIKATAKASFMESGAALAENLLPEMQSLVELLSDLLQWVSNLDGGTLKMIGTILLVVAAISPVAGAISGIAKAIAAVNVVIPTLTSGLTALSGAFGISAGWIGIIAAGVAALAALFVHFYETNDAFREKVTAAWEAVKQVVLDAVESIKNAIDSISSLPGKVVSFVTGGGKGSWSGSSSGSFGRSAVPGFASGGVFMPNSPVLGILGDNRTEREIAAPESALIETFNKALNQRGGGGAQTVNIQFTGSLAQLGRVLQPVITTETARQGVNLIR